MSDGRDDEYAQHLLDACRDSVRRSEASEEVYRKRVAQHVARGAEVGRSEVDSEVRASSDAIVRGAASDGAFYRDRAVMYGVAFLAELFSVEIEESE